LEGSTNKILASCVVNVAFEKDERSWFNVNVSCELLVGAGVADELMNGVVEDALTEADVEIGVEVFVV
jgi:hypothetical protein